MFGSSVATLQAALTCRCLRRGRGAVTIRLAVPMMRPAKAALVALQYRHRSTEMGL